MPDNLRKRLKARANRAIALANGITPKSMSVCPSEKHAKSLRKHLLRGVKPGMEYQFDCNGCLECAGGHFLRTCKKARRIDACHNCGRLTMYRVDDSKTFKLCPQCQARLLYAKVEQTNVEVKADRALDDKP